LQTCIDYGLTDISKGVRIWDKERRLNELESKTKSSPQIAARKALMAKVNRNSAAKGTAGKIDIRRASYDDIAARVAKR
jgi:hypothetical protein